MVFMYIGSPLQVTYKGRQLNRYKLYGESQKKKAKHYIWNIINITNRDYEKKVVVS
jgi:hypothetical protein